MPSPLLSVEKLNITFDTDEKQIRAVRDVSFTVQRGEALGIVGESGCGKSVTAAAILRLIPCPPGKIESGRILFEGENLLNLPIDKLRRIRGNQISMIFQDPMTALSPLQTIGNQLMETLQLHRSLTRRQAAAESRDWLERVGISDAAQRLRLYPHQLSGGMRQRVMIAMALMLDPALIIADEPTTALDVTIQAQVFALINAMKKKDTSLLLITHDMGVIWEMCDRVVVMYASQVVESGSREEIFAHPAHPYTRGLLRSMPSLVTPGNRLPAIPGQVPSPLHYPPGCHFYDRCPEAFARCRKEKPLLYPCGSGHQAACFCLDSPDNSLPST